MMHELKTWSHVFNAVERGVKPWEFRRDDRGFTEGDAVLLREWLPNQEAYSGAVIAAEIGYILRGPAFGIPDGYAIFTLKALAEGLDWQLQRAEARIAELEADDKRMVYLKHAEREARARAEEAERQLAEARVGALEEAARVCDSYDAEMTARAAEEIRELASLAHKHTS